jgi:nitrite reductase/ring-hydroxylating ferredoxin subunit/uncharacterized membrane protein
MDHDFAPVDALDNTIKSMSLLRKGGAEVKHTLHKAVLQGGNGSRYLADLLHGTWLGHPLHPVLTDVTIGAWVFGTVFDVLWKISGRRNMRDAADTLTTIGTVSAVPTALTGLTDFSTIKNDAVEYGAAHGVLNTVILSLYVLSVRARKNGYRDTGIFLSSLGVGISLLSAWLGGEMVYRYRVGVNHTEKPSEPEDWQPVMMEFDLLEGEPLRLDFEGEPVLFYRTGGQIYAIGAVCAHAGGPLEEGTFEGTCVQCPWHDSVYDLRDGSVVHGPSTYRQPSYGTRVNNGHIEIRLAR